MIPLRSLVEARVVVGPPALIRYNNLRAVTVRAAPRPAYPRDRRSRRWKRSQHDASRRICGEWTDTAFQEKRAEGKTTMILGFAVLFAYLFLVALYESWTIPVPVLLSVSVGILGRSPRSSSAADARSLRPDRHNRADRSRGQERHPHRRIREGAEGARHPAARGGNGGRAAALPAGDDDVARFHPRPAAAGRRHRRSELARAATSGRRYSAA